MYSRRISVPDQSFFLFGPRSTGKSSWVSAQFPDSLLFDLLNDDTFNDFLARPHRLEERIGRARPSWVVIDEIQKVPALLDEVHRLIERKKIKFILTGSSARKLKRESANLLAGRALTLSCYPLTASEVGRDFDLQKALRFGMLPLAVTQKSPEAFLKSYVTTYLKEEVQAEGLVRNLGSFARFLEAASFSQAQPLNITKVAEDCHINRKLSEAYFQILQDLLLSHEVPVFSRRAKRKVTQHPKFYFFDAGIFRSIRPQGILDSESETDGAALETLVLQELVALNSYLGWNYQICFWRTQQQLEVDFVLYGKRGFHAIEVKRGSRVSRDDLVSLKAFLTDYPEAKATLLYRGQRSYFEGPIEIVPVQDWFREVGKRF